MVKKLEAGQVSGVIREFNTETSLATIVKKSEDVTRRQAMVIYLDFLPPSLRKDLLKGQK